MFDNYKCYEPNFWTQAQPILAYAALLFIFILLFILFANRSSRKA